MAQMSLQPRYTNKLKELPPEAYEYYMTHPVEFAQEQILGLSPDDVKKDRLYRRLEPQTKSILYNIGKHDYVSVFSGRGCTKTTSLALAAIWWIWTRNDAKVMATGPKFEQLKITLWAEIAKWLDKSYVSDEVKLTSERIFHIDPKMHSFGQIMTSKEKDNMAGVHATHVLWLIDEASNVDQDIIDAIFGGMTDPESKVVMTGNPTRASGPFFDSQNKFRDQWRCLRFSSEDSALKNKVWFSRMLRYPKESDIFRVYVLGLPPLGNPKAIISLADCHAAVNRETPAEDYLEMGVDPAREGNDLTAIAIRRGMKLLEVRVYPKTKGPEVIGYTLKMLREYRAKTGIKSRVKIKIDDHGLGGPIGDEMALNEIDNIEVIPCLFGGKGDDRYTDPASIMWFGLADIINDVELCNDEELIEELSTREWNPSSGGRMQVEPKAKYKERLGRSPDRADATVLCYYGGAKKVFELPDIIGEKENDFEIDWNYEHLTDASYGGIFMIDVLHYAALVFNKDLSFNGLAAVYQYYSDKLWIYEEFYQDRPEPDVIARVVRALTHKGLYDDDREVRIIGNEHMFRPDGDRRPLSDVLIHEKLYISEPLRYDEYGAIAFGSKMFSENKVTLHRKLTRARPAISLWSVKKGTPETDENGYCKAFLLILSEVRRRVKERKTKRTPKDYSPVHVKSNEREKNMNSWCGR